MDEPVVFRVHSGGGRLTPQEFEQACKRFEPRFLRTTLPLYVHHADHRHLRALPIGTGFLLAVAERRFVVTARHVVSGCGVNDQLVLTNNISGDRFTTQAPRLIRPAAETIDYAILPLDDKDVERLGGMEFVGVKDFAITDQTDPNVFRLVGYPQELANDDPRYRTALHLTAHLARPPLPKGLDLFEPHHHLVLEILGEHVRDEQGELARVPDLRSVSGGPLWRITRTNGDDFDLVDVANVQLAGIETAVLSRTGGRLLVKSVSSTALVGLLANLGEDVRAVLGQTPLAPAQAR